MASLAVWNNQLLYDHQSIHSDRWYCYWFCNDRKYSRGIMIVFSKAYFFVLDEFFSAVPHLFQQTVFVSAVVPVFYGKRFHFAPSARRMAIPERGGIRHYCFVRSQSFSPVHPWVSCLLWFYKYRQEQDWILGSEVFPPIPDVTVFIQFNYSEIRGSSTFFTPRADSGWPIISHEDVYQNDCHLKRRRNIDHISFPYVYIQATLYARFLSSRFLYNKSLLMIPG